MARWREAGKWIGGLLLLALVLFAAAARATSLVLTAAVEQTARRLPDALGPDVRWPERQAAGGGGAGPRVDVLAQVEDVQSKVVMIEVTIPWGEGSGSGFLFTDRGHIMTNAHVVEGAARILVRDAAERPYDAWIVGISTERDVAVLEAPGLRGREPLALETERVPVQGDEVVAFGSPFGLQNTVTAGIVSGVGRSLVVGGVHYEGLIQVTAALNPGNSGGPLVDRSTGKVIGINTLAVDPTQAHSIGFAIPIRQALELAAEWGVEP